MTTRPGNVALDLLRWERGKHVAHLLRIVRQDGEELRLTDHDRKITFEGAVYTPINFGSMSADRREAAMRSGNQEATGWIDGSIITVEDMDAHRYRGAEVFQIVVDWARPWIVYGRHRRFVRSVVRTGASFVATLEGRTQVLQRPSGGRFGGTFSTTCPYELGGVHCKKDISADVKTAATVLTVVDNRRIVEFNTVGFGGSYADNYYKDGSVLWLNGANEGTVSPIVSYIHSSRRIEFLFPTPKPIEAGDQGRVSPGCDGLFSTCKAKFANQLNFGGDPFAPSAQAIIEPVDEQ